MINIFSPLIRKSGEILDKVDGLETNFTAAIITPKVLDK
jgi:hypothetical protein